MRKEWRRLTKQYEIESLRNGRAFYRWHCVVSEDEPYLGGNDKYNSGYSIDAHIVEGDKEFRQKVKVDIKQVYTIGKDIFSNAKKLEKTLTPIIKEAVESIGAYNEGLEYAVKSEASINRKIRDRYVEYYITNGINIKMEDIASSLSDVNRYTAILDVDQFVEQYEQINTVLEKQGLIINKVKNTFKVDGATYKGVNNNYFTPDGTVFELQFHTKESFELKNVKLHEIYEEERLVETTPERKKELKELMKKLSFALTIPKDIDKI